MMNEKMYNHKWENPHHLTFVSVAEILHFTHNTLRAGHNIEDMISHGIDLMSSLLPITVSHDELRHFLSHIARHVTAPDQSSVLLMVRTSCDFLLTHREHEAEQVKQLVRHLLEKGRRNDIRSVFKLCSETFLKEEFSFMWKSLYLFGRGQLNSKQLQALSQVCDTYRLLSSTSAL